MDSTERPKFDFLGTSRFREALLVVSGKRRGEKKKMGG